MPTVKTTKIYFITGQITRTINCDSSGNFTAKFPSEVAEAFGETHAKGSSLQECENDWDKKIKEFKKMKTIKKKVIYYHIGTEIKWSHDKMHLEIAAQVLEETCITDVSGKARYTYKRPQKHHESYPGGTFMVDDDCGMPEDLYRNMEMPYSHNGDVEENLIDFTPQSLAFFVSFHDAFKRLIDRVEHLTKTPQALAKTIKKGALLLPAPKKDL